MIVNEQLQNITVALERAVAAGDLGAIANVVADLRQLGGVIESEGQQHDVNSERLNAQALLQVAKTFDSNQSHDERVKSLEIHKQQHQRKEKEAKEALSAHMAKHHPHVAHIELCYAGSCDEGAIEEVRCYDTDARQSEIKDELLDTLLDDLFYLVTPPGFEINDGGNGEIHVYLATQKVIVHHNQNVVHQEHASYEV